MPLAMTCSQKISITKVSESPCCSWRIIRQHDCKDATARLFPDGEEEVKLFSPVYIRKDGLTYTLADKQTAFYFYYADVITIDGVQLDKDAVPEASFEGYLHNLFCCSCGEEEEIACGNFILTATGSSATCNAGRVTFTVSIANISSGAIPAGTVFNLAFNGIGDNAVYSVVSGPASIAPNPNGSSIQITADWAVNGIITIQVVSDNEGCEDGLYSVSISPIACVTMSPNPLVITASYP